MINLFLDSNIWLDLFHYSSNDLEEFSKLNGKLNKDIKLFVTDQVVFELQRNRDAKINDAYRKFKDFKVQMPNLCKGYPQHDVFNRLYGELSTVHRELCHNIEVDFANKSLPADKLINTVYANALQVPEKPGTVQAAQLRYQRGNPPGKNNSLGDAINWECLLSAVPDKQDLYFVSADKDFQSPMDNNRMNLFLVNEWSRRKGSQVVYYSSLVSFLREHQKDIDLKSENEKEQLIEALSNSGSFAQTHGIVAQLMRYDYLSDKQMNQAFRAAATNHQVGAILDDWDISKFFSGLVNGRLEKVENLDELKWVLTKAGVALPS